MENVVTTYVPEPAISRLPWYLACVSRLRAQGVEYVSSTAISHQLNVDASQIAKDLSYLNIKGKTRIGYEVKELEQGLLDFLGFHREHNAVMMGVGSLGAALMADSGLTRYGLHIVAGFDVNPKITGTSIGEVPVYHIDSIYEVMRSYPASIGILTVPVECAQDCADIAIAAGIKAIWNFTPYRVKVAQDIVMANTSIYAHLALIYNRLNNPEK